MKIKRVFFDWGDTLAYLNPPDPVDIWLMIAAELRLNLKREPVKQALEEATKRFSPMIYDHAGRTDEFWIIYDGFILQKLGIDDHSGTLARAIGRAFDQDRWFRLYPETHGALEALKQQGYALGIISNNTDQLLKRLKGLGIANYFDSVTYSQEVGADKPDPTVFKLALRRAKCLPENAVHVGNNYEIDVIGARRVGITPILIDRNIQHPDAECLRITDLRGIDQCLLHLGD